MDQFIKQVSTQTGVDESQAKDFIGKILEFINKNAPEEVTKDISAKIPESDKLIADAKTAASSGSTDNELLKPCMPVFEMLKKLINDIVGGDAAKAVEVANIMEKTGVSPEQGAGMIQKLLTFLEGKVGADTVKKLTEQVPALQGVIA